MICWDKILPQGSNAGLAGWDGVGVYLNNGNAKCSNPMWLNFVHDLEFRLK